jgi:S-DNA-T family DNA segregation ATPase FtsK/SpoIIIE
MTSTTLHTTPSAKINWRGIFPTWTYQPEELKSAVARKTRRGIEFSLFHTVRSPRYWGRASRHAFAGTRVCAVEYGKWMVDADGRYVKKSTARGDSEAQSGYLEIRDAHWKDVRNRFGGTVLAMPITYFAAPALWSALSDVQQFGIAAGAFTIIPPVLGLIGKPEDETIMDTVQYSGKALELDASFIVQALSKGVHPTLTKAIAEDPRCVQFIGEVARDGQIHGWVARFQLPEGVIAKDVLTKKDVFIGNMRGVKRSQVELTTDDDPAILELTVTDKPLSEMPMPQWPHMNATSMDVSKPFSVAYTSRHEDVRMSMDGTSVLVGGSPNSGKSQTDSLLIAAHVLDPLADIAGLWQFKATGDFDIFADVAFRNVVGGSDANLAACVKMLEEENKNQEIRSDLIRKSPLCPKHSLTREAAAADPRLRYRIIIIDEIQRLILHPELGPKAIPLLRSLAELGRAAGIRLVLSTQTPSADALPTGITNSLTTRIAHRLMTHEVNDRVLSSGSYSAGWKANELDPMTPGMAIIEGQGATVRARMYYLSPEDLEAIVERGLALRGGVVEQFTEAAAEEVVAEAERILDLDGGYELNTNLQFLVDVNTVVEGEKKVQVQQIFERLLEAFGPRYEKTDSVGVEMMLKANGVRIIPDVHKKKNGKIDETTGERKNTTRKGIDVLEFRKVINR